MTITTSVADIAAMASEDTTSKRPQRARTTSARSRAEARDRCGPGQGEEFVSSPLVSMPAGRWSRSAS